MILAGGYETVEAIDAEIAKARQTGSLKAQSIGDARTEFGARFCMYRYLDWAQWEQTLRRVRRVKLEQASPPK